MSPAGFHLSSQQQNQNHWHQTLVWSSMINAQEAICDSARACHRNQLMCHHAWRGRDWKSEYCSKKNSSITLMVLCSAFALSRYLAEWKYCKELKWTRWTSEETEVCPSDWLKVWTSSESVQLALFLCLFSSFLSYVFFFVNLITSCWLTHQCIPILFSCVVNKNSSAPVVFWTIWQVEFFPSLACHWDAFGLCVSRLTANKLTLTLMETWPQQRCVHPGEVFNSQWLDISIELFLPLILWLKLLVNTTSATVLL